MAFIGRVFAVPAFSPPYKSWSTWTKQAENRPSQGLGTSRFPSLRSQKQVRPRCTGRNPREMDYACATRRGVYRGQRADLKWTKTEPSELVLSTAIRLRRCRTWSTWTTKRLITHHRSPAGWNISRNCSRELVDWRTVFAGGVRTGPCSVRGHATRGRVPRSQEFFTRIRVRRRRVIHRGRRRGSLGSPRPQFARRGGVGHRLWR